VTSLPLIVQSSSIRSRYDARRAVTPGVGLSSSRSDERPNALRRSAPCRRSRATRRARRRPPIRHGREGSPARHPAQTRAPFRPPSQQPDDQEHISRAAWQLSIAAIGLTCSNRRHPGSDVALPTTPSPIFNSSTRECVGDGGQLHSLEVALCGVSGTALRASSSSRAAASHAR